MKYTKQVSPLRSCSFSQHRKFALFAGNFLKHPRMLGSIIPSSPFLVRRLLRRIDWQQAKVLVEYGPGIGTFTQQILRRMRPDAILIVLETNKDFVNYIKEAYPDPRLEVVHGSAADIQHVLQERHIDKVDYVLAGIPFSTLPGDTRENILHATRQVIVPGGAFLLYQFSPSTLPQLREIFSKVTHGFEPINFLPAHFYQCTP
ncbi:class I SAM-dependent methyltransferase [Pistricoccus aurantiacus]|uniref:class I SAM-dependent methyltransferase n=1 Tax=Pistricoccus aurantiacus TaxID=1883414 RepID=UPI003637FBD3